MSKSLASILSAREEEILALAGMGLRDQEIAKQLQVSPHTVRSYWKRIKNKTNVGSRTQLVRMRSESFASEDLSRQASDLAFCHAVLQSLNLPILVLDQDGRLFRCNPAAEKLFGKLEQEMVGQLLGRNELPDLCREAAKACFENHEAEPMPPVICETEEARWHVGPIRSTDYGVTHVVLMIVPKEVGSSK